MDAPMPKDAMPTRTRLPLLRKPVATDGALIWELVKSCKPLDENSIYCNIVQAEHFRDTCVVAELDGAIVGWISGHMIPNTDELFIWQVAVSPTVRGFGLGKKMLRHLLSRNACDTATSLKTTITRDNAASWALFRSFARSVGGSLSHRPHYTRDTHFDGRAATEYMVTITLAQGMTEAA